MLGNTDMVPAEFQIKDFLSTKKEIMHNRKHAMGIYMPARYHMVCLYPVV